MAFAGDLREPNTPARALAAAGGSGRLQVLVNNAAVGGFTPVAETMEAYAALIKAGKVRIVGASNVSPNRFKTSLDASRKLGLPRYETLQPLYNLFGYVIDGIDVAQGIQQGDVMQSVAITERATD